MIHVHVYIFYVWCRLVPPKITKSSVSKAHKIIPLPLCIHSVPEV